MSLVEQRIFCLPVPMSSGLTLCKQSHLAPLEVNVVVEMLLIAVSLWRADILQMGTVFNNQH